MKAALVLAFVVCLIAVASALTTDQMKDYVKIVKEVNSDPASTWKAGINSALFDQDMTSFQNMMGDLSVLDVNGYNRLPEKKCGWNTEVKDLPKNFLAAQNWPRCEKVITTVHDQSACGSCWAVSVGAAATERYCIANNENLFLSTRDILSCCPNCGMGCNGGYPSSAWSYIRDSGIPTGSPDSTNSTLCVRYPFLSCKHHTEGEPQCSDYDFSTPKCQKACDSDSTYRTEYSQDKRKMKSSYSVRGEAAMMQDLYQYGPMSVSYTVYSDFMTYQSGVYQHKSGSSLGGHAVTLEGWGETNEGLKYWIKNNWNNSWGESGYFRIVRGQNECGIESGAAAGQW